MLICFGNLFERCEQSFSFFMILSLFHYLICCYICLWWDRANGFKEADAGFNCFLKRKFYFITTQDLNGIKCKLFMV